MRRSQTIWLLPWRLIVVSVAQHTPPFAARSGTTCHWKLRAPTLKSLPSVRNLRPFSAGSWYLLYAVSILSLDYIALRCTGETGLNIKYAMQVVQGQDCDALDGHWQEAACVCWRCFCCQQHSEGGLWVRCWTTVLQLLQVRSFTFACKTIESMFAYNLNNLVEVDCNN